MSDIFVLILLLVLFTIQKHISSLTGINRIIPVKTALIDEMCNKSRELAKGIWQDMGQVDIVKKLEKTGIGQVWY